MLAVYLLGRTTRSSGPSIASGVAQKDIPFLVPPFLGCGLSVLAPSVQELVRVFDPGL